MGCGASSASKPAVEPASTKEQPGQLKGSDQVVSPSSAGSAGASQPAAAPAPAANGNGGAAPAPKSAADEAAENQVFLERVALFKRLPADELPNLVKACEATIFQPGDVIIKEGDEGQEFYVMKSGTAKVTVNETMVATLRGKDYFGENALLRDEPRNASIIAQSKIDCLKITRAKFMELGLSERLEFAKRGAVGGGATEEVAVQPPCGKTPAEEKLIEKALADNENLKNMMTLDAAKAKTMIDLMWKQAVKKGETIIKEGDDGDYLYVVNTGTFEIIKVDEACSAEKQMGRASSLGQIGAGRSFGELALLYFAPRAATITATADSEVFVLARQQFKLMISNSQEAQSATYVKHLDKVELLESLKADEKLEIASALTDFSFVQGENIFEQGEKGVLFYILVEGEVSVVIDGKETSKIIATEDNKPMFGERALLNGDVRAATIKVISSTVMTLSLDKMSFDMLVGPLDEIKDRGKTGTKCVRKTMMADFLPKPKEEKRFGVIKYAELKKLGLLGCGGFGAVELVEHLTSGDVYALKELSKGYVLKTGMQKSVTSEKNVQLMCDSVFIVKLYETYNLGQSLYLLLELALGGELYATYNRKQLWGSEKCAKFYVAGTVFAFTHLHERKIIFRDLKPENLLLNDKGQVKLTDMGLAKVCLGKTFTTCGTPDYFAPELIASKGHNEAVDWWTLGILCFELLGGHPPFESASPMQIYQKVTKGILKVQFPKACRGSVESLLKGLCNADPSARPPMKKGGTQNIKDHEWYKGFDWDQMESQAMIPPYAPKVKNKKDMANFSARKEDRPPSVPYKDPKNGWDKDFATSS